MKFENQAFEFHGNAELDLLLPKDGRHPRSVRVSDPTETWDSSIGRYCSRVPARSQAFAELVESPRFLTASFNPSTMLIFRQVGMRRMTSICNSRRGHRPTPSAESRMHQLTLQLASHPIDSPSNSQQLVRGIPRCYMCRMGSSARRESGIPRSISSHSSR
jgi:hypothetical protein